MLDQLSNLSCYFEAERYCDLIFFQFTALLNPDFNCSKSFLSLSFDKVTTETCNFVSASWNSNPVGVTIAGGSSLFPAALTVISAKGQFLYQVKINSISQLINGQSINH